MPTRKRTGNKQPAKDPALKKATQAAAKGAEADAKTGNVATADEPADTIPAEDRPLTYPGHDHPSA